MTDPDPRACVGCARVPPRGRAFPPRDDHGGPRCPYCRVPPEVPAAPRVPTIPPGRAYDGLRAIARKYRAR